tara:strand:- start:671 stop:2038 length:1368 start_codon:yes stop_codon:yes gene_type:complete
MEPQEDNLDKINLIEFSRIIKDFIDDLNITFRDKIEDLILSNQDLNIIFSQNKSVFLQDNLLDNIELSQSINNLYVYCKQVFPARFFDIIYQNQDIFDGSCNTNFLPTIDFSIFFFDTTSQQTKETIWKYLQMVLFTIVTSIDDKSCFGDNTQLFEAINSNVFKDKLSETIQGMENLFSNKTTTSDVSENAFNFENMFNDMSNNNFFNDMSNNNFFNDMSNNNFFNNMPNSETIHDHINKLINGKIGSIAKELAEETTRDLDIDCESIKDPNDIFKELFKNPNKLLSLVSNIGNKLDKKMKDGSIKESELLEEATSIFKNMNSMPGMNNLDDLFKSMNLGDLLPKGGKVNTNAFQNMMDQNIKMAKMKERMKKKADNKNTTTDTNANANLNSSQNNNINLESNNLKDINKNLNNLIQQMNNNNSFIEDIVKNQSTQSNETTNKKKPNKKKANRKK